MSVPHTGQLSATIRGNGCDFNGEVWSTPDPALTQLLNLETAIVPKHHSDIREIAEQVLRRLGLLREVTIDSWRPDSWGPRDRIPRGALD